MTESSSHEMLSFAVITITFKISGGTSESWRGIPGSRGSLLLSTRRCFTLPWSWTSINTMIKLCTTPLFVRADLWLEKYCGVGYATNQYLCILELYETHYVTLLANVTVRKAKASWSRGERKTTCCTELWLVESSMVRHLSTITLISSSITRTKYRWQGGTFL